MSCDLAPIHGSLLSSLCIAAMVFVMGCGKPIEVEQEKATSVSEQEAVQRSKAEPKQVTRQLNRLVDKTFDDIKFEIEPDAPYDNSLLTDAIRELDGQRIRIRGYILPTARKRGLKEFVLVRDNQECCFGPGAALFDCILVNMKPNQTAEFSVRPVAVEGEFKLSEFIGPDGSPWSIYLLHGEAVK